MREVIAGSAPLARGPKHNIVGSSLLMGFDRRATAPITDTQIGKNRLGKGVKNEERNFWSNSSWNHHEHHFL